MAELQTKGLKSWVLRWLGIEPVAQEQQFLVRESTTHSANVLKNKIWYRGDPAELEQFYKQLCMTDTNVYSTTIPSKFWAAVPNGNVKVRKVHSGLPAMMIDTLSSIVVNDLIDPTIEDSALHKRWEDFCDNNPFLDIVDDAVQQVLITGDGAFKLSIAPDVSEQPLLEFFGADRVDYEYKHGRLQAIIFKSEYTQGKKHYQLQERYSRGAVDYKLFGDNNKEVLLNTLEETKNLKPVTFSGDFMMAVPFKVYRSSKFKYRGQPLLDKKSDALDALDETLSTWIDGMRTSRTKQYIPENLIPKNENGEPMQPDVFNPYFATNPKLAEEDNGKIETQQGVFDTTGLLQSYITFLDVCLQGVLSPSTLGIDVKKLDNADAQREKEKTTMYTRDKIINALKTALEELFDVVMRTQDNMLSKAPPEDGYKAVFEWGQYANPSFEALVETMAKAKTAGIMSTERIVEELYGDDLDEKERELEVQRIKEEYGTAATPMEEPAIGDEEILGGNDESENPNSEKSPENSGNKQPPVPNGGKAV